MSPSIDIAQILERLQSTLGALDGLRKQIGLPPSVADRGATPEGPPRARRDGRAAAELLPLIDRLRHAFVGHSLNSLGELSKTILRPISANAIWADQPSLKSTSIYAAQPGPDTWKRAFPDFKETVTNIVGNERYLTVESRGVGTHSAPLKLAGKAIPPTMRQVTVHTANVVTLDGGSAVRFEHYYDLAGVFQQLGMLPNVPMGHDEPMPSGGAKGTMKIPPLMHPAGGFLSGSPESWPVVVGEPPSGAYNVSIGSSSTPAAQANVNNCKAIHGAFVDHTPDKFRALLARH